MSALPPTTAPARPGKASAQAVAAPMPPSASTSAPSLLPASPSALQVAVIGAGWAGLSAACHLHASGASVTVFEAGHTLGGRARRVGGTDPDNAVDNGQHLLLGAYTETLSLMHALGAAPEQRLCRMPLTLRAADGSFLLQASPLPAPWHLLTAIISARGLDWRDKWQLLRALTMLRLRGWRTPAGITVAQWLAQSAQSPRLVRQLWQPLCLAAMNTPPEQACAQLFANVLRDSTGAQAWASDFLVPRVDLTALWPDCLPPQIHVHTGTPVRTLQLSDDGTVQVNGQHFQAVIVATNAPSAARLLATLPAGTGMPGTQPDAAAVNDYLAPLQALQHRPIATLTLALDAAWRPPFPVLLLRDDLSQQQHGQWLFDQNYFLNRQASASDGLLTIVISDADVLSRLPEQAVVDGILAQMRTQVPGGDTLPALRWHQLIIEKRATFSATPGLARLPNHSPWASVWVAGDWTDTGYPAVLEGAVRSGKQAASLLLRSHTA